MQSVSPLRSRLLAIALLGAQLLLVAAQAPDRTGGSGSLLEATTLRLVAPLARGVAAIGDLFAAAGRALRGRATLARENRELRAELRELRREHLRLDALELETEALSTALDYARESGLELRPVEVVYLDRRSWLRTLLVRVGDRGAQVDQVVLCERGVVGRVIETSGPWAKVQLITDRAAAIGVLLEGALRQGVAHGSGPRELELDYVPRQVAVALGDRVVTAGIDGIYPRGLPVGVVSAVEPGSEMFHHIRVRPAMVADDLATVYLLDRAVVPRTSGTGDESGVR